jgi:hypothetical protein
LREAADIALDEGELIMRGEMEFVSCDYEVIRY